MTAKKIITKFYAPEKSRNWLLHPFARRYLSHIIIIVIAGLTLAANLNANESRREDLNKTSIISNLITTEDLGAIEEEGPIAGAGKKVSRYLGQTGVSSQPQTQADEEIEEIRPQTVAGNSALVRQILSPVEEDLRQRDKIIVYTVQEGDSISQIAEKFGISNQTIIWENNLSAYSIIRPGDKLVILPVSGIRHKVLKGETLAKIAKKYGIDGEKIIEFNKLASANDLQIGEQLIIPGGKKIYAVATYTARGVYLPTGAVPASTGRMLWPTACRYISQYFGWRHSGLDIACGFGAPILAANSGIVIKAQTGYNSGYGRMIIIDHGNGQQTLYGHMTKLYVSAGQTVSRGQKIGAMGSTGRSTGPHLHFEVRSGGVRRNPLSYIR